MAIEKNGWNTKLSFASFGVAVISYFITWIRTDRANISISLGMISLPAHYDKLLFPKNCYRARVGCTDHWGEGEKLDYCENLNLKCTCPSDRWIMRYNGKNRNGAHIYKPSYLRRRDERMYFWVGPSSV